MGLEVPWRQNLSQIIKKYSFKDSVIYREKPFKMYWMINEWMNEWTRNHILIRKGYIIWLLQANLPQACGSAREAKWVQERIQEELIWVKWQWTY